MTVACPECRSVFRVDPSKVPASGVRARCAVCGGIIAIDGGTLPVTVASEVAGSVGTGPSRAAVPSASGGPSAARPLAAAPSPPAASFSGAPAYAPTPALGAPVIGAPAVPVPVLTPPPVTPRQPTPAYSDIPVSFPVFGRTHGAPASSDAGAAHAGMGAPRPDEVAVDAAEAAVSAPPVSAPPSPSAPIERTPAPAAAPNAAPSGGVRPSVNPFLRADPEARARRLARALVSDLVAYHPQKRDEGVRDGTLRQLFRDDIRRSYEEYVEQVGRELAEGTRHFQDALNEILAGGRALF